MEMWHDGSLAIGSVANPRWSFDVKLRIFKSDLSLFVFAGMSDRVPLLSGSLRETGT